MRQSGQATRQSESDAASDRPLIAGRYRIDLRQPLPRLDTPSAKAYAAADRDDAEASLFALLAQPTMPVRMEALQRLQGALAAGFLAPLASGVVRCPTAQRNTMAIVYDRPGGGTLADHLADHRAGGYAGLSEYDLPPRLIAPVAEALQAMADRGVTHRAIRPDNLHFMDRPGGEVALGDCLTASPAHDQPLLFEPIERAMAERTGRGDGNTNDDLYAFGVTLALVVLRGNPFAGLDDDQILSAKLERGSYDALCGRHRVPQSLIEPLRGMLCDDAEQRWGLAQLMGWLEGRRCTPLRRAVEPTPLSAFRFQGKEYTSLRRLVHALIGDVDAAAAVIRDGELQTWLSRCLKVPDLAAAVAEAARNSAGGTGSNPFLVARVAILLDSQGPIRYRGRAFMLDGLGPCLAATCLQQQDVQPFAEAIALGLPHHWLAQQSSPRTRWNEVPSFFTRLQAHLETLGPGGGWERCLYELNPGLPCQSPHLAGHYVYQLDAALRALDALAEHAATETAAADRFPVDRHVAAFAAARLDRESAPHLKLLASSRPERCVAGMLGLLALLQIRVGVASLPGLASLFGNRLGPVIATYRSRTLRLDVERQVAKVAKTGRLPDLYTLVENPERRRQDRDGFRTAAAEFASAERIILALQSDGPGHAAAWTVAGQRFAAGAALIVSGIAIGVMLLLRIS